MANLKLFEGYKNTSSRLNTNVPCIPETDCLREPASGAFCSGSLGLKRLGKQISGKDINIAKIPNTMKPSHQAPIQAGCLGDIGTSEEKLQNSVSVQKTTESNTEWQRVSVISLFSTLFQIFFWKKVR